MNYEEIILLLCLNEDDHEIRFQRRRTLKHLRDKGNPFQLQESTFKEFFRMPPTLCWHIIQELKSHDEQKTSLTFEIQFLSVLWFLAHGSYQKCIANNYVVPLSQPSVSRCIHYICNLINEVYFQEVKFPITEEEKTKKKSG